MYKGKRDDHLTIRVPQRLCYLYESKSGEEFVEIRLPNGNDDTWYSFMVKPAQVFYDYEEPDLFNVIEGEKFFIEYDLILLVIAVPFNLFLIN